MNPPSNFRDGSRKVLRTILAIVFVSAISIGSPQNFGGSIRVESSDDRQSLSRLVGDPVEELSIELSSLAQIESGGNANAVGRKGERGIYQFGRAAWTDACRILGCAHKFKTVLNETIASRHAAALFSSLKSRLAATLERIPTNAENYCAWNLGLTGFKRRGFRVDQCPRSTRDAAERFANLLREASRIAWQP